jgi:hypothetical protein
LARVSLRRAACRIDRSSRCSHRRCNRMGGELCRTCRLTFRIREAIAKIDTKNWKLCAWISTLMAARISCRTWYFALPLAMPLVGWLVLECERTRPAVRFMGGQSRGSTSWLAPKPSGDLQGSRLIVRTAQAFVRPLLCDSSRSTIRRWLATIARA